MNWTALPPLTGARVPARCRRVLARRAGVPVPAVVGPSWKVIGKQEALAGRALRLAAP